MKKILVWIIVFNKIFEKCLLRSGRHSFRFSEKIRKKFKTVFIGSPRGALILIYRSSTEDGVFLPHYQKFLAIQLGLPGEVRGYIDWLLQTIWTFLAICFPELWGREHEISKGEILRGVSRPLDSGVFYPEVLEYVC